MGQQGRKSAGCGKVIRVKKLSACQEGGGGSAACKGWNYVSKEWEGNEGVKRRVSQQGVIKGWEWVRLMWVSCVNGSVECGPAEFEGLISGNKKK